MDIDDHDEDDLSPQITREEQPEPQPLQQISWSAKYKPTTSNTTQTLSGDKILLPASALEGILAAAPITHVNGRPNGNVNGNGALTSTFDPFNPYTFAAERNARAVAAGGGGGGDIQRQQSLPHPLTFRLVNSRNGRVVFAGIREFSAAEREVGLSSFLRKALGLSLGEENGEHEEEEEEEITVHARQLPRGTYVRLRPLEAGYDPDDWKVILERYLRDHFTTLTLNEKLSVTGGRGERFEFLVDLIKPMDEAENGDKGVCIVDTDLEVEILPLSEEQARESLRRRVEKRERIGADGGSSVGGEVKVGTQTEGEGVFGQVLRGEVVDYEVSMWDRDVDLVIEMEALDDTGDEVLDLMVSPFSSRHRNRPREDEHVFAAFEAERVKNLVLKRTNADLEAAEKLFVAVRAWKEEGQEQDSTPFRYNLRIYPQSRESSSSQDNGAPTNGHASNPDETQCKNCKQYIPKRTLFLHENFCLRNNIACPDCGNVFQKRSPEWEAHWHCPHDSSHGNTSSSRAKHDALYHTPTSCPSCPTLSFPSILTLSTHKTTTCPSKPILCQFCHLETAQQGPGDPDFHSAEVLLSNGLTPHEVSDSARTTECHLCARVVRLRDMETHMKLHDLDRKARPSPRICRNILCGRTLDGFNTTNKEPNKPTKANDNILGLCATCFGPLYVAVYDPSYKSLKRRVERRYLSQLLTGCGKSWCTNEFCKTGRGTENQDGGKTLGTKEILPLIKPYVDAAVPATDGTTPTQTSPLHFCTDEASQTRRKIAPFLRDMTADEGREFSLEWCLAALEASGGNGEVDLQKAREWLGVWGVGVSEV